MKTDLPTFQPFPKMARYSRDCVITEKIDGTNSQIFIWDSNHLVPLHPGKKDDLLVPVGPAPSDVPWLWNFCDSTCDIRIAAGSRNRWLTEQEDNYGFAKWVIQNHEQLQKLGHGRHFGEWWGHGINRGYGLTKYDRRFSLFNTAKWRSEFDRPACCSLVPILYQGEFGDFPIQGAINTLWGRGSLAAPGFQDPEGIVIYHSAANICFKKTIKNDAKPKTFLQ